MDFREIFSSKNSFDKKFLLALPFLIGAMFFLSVSNALALCGDSDCNQLMGWHECVPEGTPSPPCYYDEANDTYLIFQRDSDMGNCTTTNGLPGWWFWRAQWTGECGTCCTGDSVESCDCGVCIPCGCGLEIASADSAPLAEENGLQVESRNLTEGQGFFKVLFSSLWGSNQMMASIFVWGKRAIQALFKNL